MMMSIINETLGAVREREREQKSRKDRLYL